MGRYYVASVSVAQWLITSHFTFHQAMVSRVTIKKAQPSKRVHVRVHLACNTCVGNCRVVSIFRSVYYFPLAPGPWAAISRNKHAVSRPACRAQRRAARAQTADSQRL